MILINKPINPPEVRFISGGRTKIGQLKWRVAQLKLLADLKNDSTIFTSPNYNFKHDFGRKEYSAALKKCQGNKCCFCEKSVDTADIEHFRPKSAWKQAKGTKEIRPGYFWLAYSWSNMLIACTECNSQKNKGNLFPINGNRAMYPSDCSTEDKILINPTEEDPSLFITFRLEIPVGIDSKGRGKENISIFNLNDRIDLLEPRRDRIGRYKAYKKILSLPEGFNTADEIKEAKIYIGKAFSAKAPFAAMIRENVKKGFI